MGFNVTCAPGKGAVAGMVLMSSELPTLLMYLDPVNISVQIPAIPGGPLILARFCHELAAAATKLAVHLDPNGETIATG